MVPDAADGPDPANATAGGRSAPESAAGPPVLVAVHLPRAAGRTLDAILARQYHGWAYLRLAAAGPCDASQPVEHRLAALSPGRLRALRAIFGPIAPGLGERALDELGLDRFLAGPARYLTVVREPVERVASLYRQVRADPAHPLHATVTDGGLSLDDCLARRLGPFADGQFRHLAGAALADRLGSGDDPDLLRRAIRLIDRRFDLIGTVDRFDDFLTLAWQRYCWQVPLYRRPPAGPAAPLDAATVELAERANLLDRELYRFAASRLAHHVDAAGPCFADRRALFGLLNATGGPA